MRFNPSLNGKCTPGTGVGTTFLWQRNDCRDPNPSHLTQRTDRRLRLDGMTSLAD